MPKVICITSAKSDLGKTTLTEGLLRRLNNWAACKVTTLEQGESDECPKGVPCGVCSSLKGNSHIEEKAEILTQPGTDTNRMLKAGARKAFWIIAKSESVEGAIKNVINRSREYEGIIFEGNHALQFLSPNVSVMLTPEGVDLKKSAKAVIHKIDIFIKNIADADIVDRILKLVNEITVKW